MTGPGAELFGSQVTAHTSESSYYLLCRCERDGLELNRLAPRLLLMPRSHPIDMNRAEENRM